MSDLWLEVSTNKVHSIQSDNCLVCAETGRVIAVFYNDYDLAAVYRMIINSERKTTIEDGINWEAFDVSYGRESINRAFRNLGKVTRRELARVFARLSRTADPAVMHEPEFKGTDDD